MGKIDIILATELSLGEGGETLTIESNDWYGAVEGIASSTATIANLALQQLRNETVGTESVG